MTTKSDYMNVAKQISDHMNVYRLAFKTYKVSDFDEMIKLVAGSGARISGATTAQEFEGALQERGFLVFPKIEDAQDGHVRVYRANSVIASLLSAFRYPGADGDSQLVSLLNKLRSNKRRTDDFDPDSAAD